MCMCKGEVFGNSGIPWYWNSQDDFIITLTKYHQWGLQRHQDFFLFQMKTLFLAIATLTFSLVNMNCIWPPIRTLTKTKSITAPPTSSLSLSPGEYLREGMCQYTCKESGGCNTQLVVDWAKVTEKW